MGVQEKVNLMTSVLFDNSSPKGIYCLLTQFPIVLYLFLQNSLTLYSVINREYLFGNEKLPVTRVTLTSMSGRTHQLNVHCAAFGHPIVGDQTYGINGRA